MAKTKLTKSAVDAAQPQAQPVELRATLVPGFLSQEWLAEVCRRGDPGAAKTAARKAPTVAELCMKFS